MKIEHIALYVNDLEASRNFFVKYFGATSNDGYLSFEDSSRLELMSKPEMSDPPKNLARTGYVHIAFRVGSREKVDELTAALQADGYEVVSGPRTTGDGYYESCILDVEQNQTKAAFLTWNRIRSRSQSENDKTEIYRTAQKQYAIECAKSLTVP